MNKIVSITLFTALLLLTRAEVTYASEGQGFLQEFLGNQMTWPIFTALLLSITAVLLQLFRKPKVARSTGTSANAIAISALQQELRTLRGGEVFSVTRTGLEILEERVKLLEGASKHWPSVREMEWTDLPRPSRLPETEDLEFTKSPEPVTEHLPSPILLYAKYADLDEGFSAHVLSTIQNGENIYEIESVDDTAVYRISSDSHAQKYALSEPSFTLGKACELENQPFKGCQIFLKRKGLLLNVSGNWIIQQKAKIEFK